MALFLLVAAATKEYDVEVKPPTAATKVKVITVSFTKKPTAARAEQVLRSELAKATKDVQNVDVLATAWDRPDDDADEVTLPDGSTSMIVLKGTKRILTEKQWHKKPASRPS